MRQMAPLALGAARLLAVDGTRLSEWQVWRLLIPKLATPLHRAAGRVTGSRLKRHRGKKDDAARCSTSDITHQEALEVFEHVGARGRQECTRTSARMTLPGTSARTRLTGRGQDPDVTLRAVGHLPELPA